MGDLLQQARDGLWLIMPQVMLTLFGVGKLIFGEFRVAFGFLALVGSRAASSTGISAAGAGRRYWSKGAGMAFPADVGFLRPSAIPTVV